MADLAIGSRIELNPPLVQGGMTYADVSEKISAITENKPPKQWYYLITISSLMTVMLFGCLGHYELRVVDRHRPCGHADLRRAFSLPAEVADLDQSRR
jgi:hypothetical protein